MKKDTFPLLLMLVALSGCATTFRGMTEDVTIKTEPPGASVQLSNGLSAKSPCTFPLPRKHAVLITIDKDGYHTHTGSLTPTLSGTGVLMGGFFDYGTGAVYDLHPNPYHVSLIPVKK